MKALIFDSSSLITLTMNGLDTLFPELKKIFQGKFLITQEVKYEVIDRPMNIKKFELEALRIKKLLDDKILELPESIGISSSLIQEKTKEILNQTNSSFSSKSQYIHLIDVGEAACLALSSLATQKGIENVIVIDERTTRMFIENIENLKKLLENKLHTKIQLNKLSIPGIRFIRSAELVYLAYKNKLIHLENNKVLDALLYAVKFKGCSISIKEIEEIKRL
ncbi:MAG: hypothetical protein NT076_05600 [Candidatus Pacearchaeota archaeon]|nr:hypothetical protein [Candidatus Pacearchaeota archaeon]